jgi:hypothetical protein
MIALNVLYIKPLLLSKTLSLDPHTSGPRDVPRCGALSLLEKTPHYRGGPAETAAGLNVKLRDLRDCLAAWWCLVGSYPLLYTEFKSRDSKIESRRGAGHSRGNAHHRAKHAVTRLPRQRCRRPTPRFCATGANGKNMCRC